MPIVDPHFTMPGADMPPQEFKDLKTQQGQINWLAQFAMKINNNLNWRDWPKFAEPIEWDINSSYGAYTIVLHDGNSYTSLQDVPKGIEISNGDYWVQTGNFNIQFEQLENEISELAQQVDNLDFPTGNIAVSEFNHVCDLTVPSGYINSVVYVSEENALYTANYNGNGTCTLYKFNFNENESLNSILEPVDSFTFENNHSNAMSYYNGYFYCFEWNGRRISQIDFSNKQVYQITSLPLLRSGAISENAFVFQPYYSNQLFCSLSDSDNPINAIYNVFNVIDIASQFEYVQDSCIYEGIYIRLLSRGNGNSYIEFIPFFNGGQSIIYPIPGSSEYEGICIVNQSLYVVGNGPVYKIDNFINYLPQIYQKNLWCVKPNLMYIADRTEVVTKKQDGYYPSTFSIHLPEEIYKYAFNSKLLNVKLNFKFPYEGNYSNETVITPLKFIGEFNFKTSSGTYTPLLVTKSISEGISFFKCIVGINIEDGKTTPKNREICIAITQKIDVTSNGITVTDNPDVSYFYAWYSM